jgi:hypothetical protein
MTVGGRSAPSVQPQWAYGTSDGPARRPDTPRAARADLGILLRVEQGRPTRIHPDATDVPALSARRGGPAVDLPPARVTDAARARGMAALRGRRHSLAAALVGPRPASSPPPCTECCSSTRDDTSPAAAWLRRSFPRANSGPPPSCQGSRCRSAGIRRNCVRMLSVASLCSGFSAPASPTLLNYWLLADDGPTVTYLIPVVAVLFGVTALGESLSPRVLVGMVVVLAGVGLARRGVTVPPTPSPGPRSLEERSLRTAPLNRARPTGRRTRDRLRGLQAWSRSRRPVECRVSADQLVLELIRPTT